MLTGELRELSIANGIVTHWRHQLPIAQHRVARLKKDVTNAEHDVELCQLALHKARCIEGELVLKLLTCGISHRKALRILQQSRGF